MQTSKAQPEQFMNTLQRIRETHSRGYGLYIHISQLRPYNRQAHHVNSAWSKFEPHLSRMGGEYTILRNGDIVATIEQASQKDIEFALLNFKKYFSHDPITMNSVGRERFYYLYNLPQQGQELTNLIENSVDCDSENVEELDHLVIGSSKGIPLDFLLELQTTLEYGDISNFIRRQPICWIEGQTAPLPVSHEFYLSIGDLRQSLGVPIDFYGNVWLFRQLTLFFDKRVLRYFKNLLATTKLSSFNLNINVQTILSKPFIDFTESLDLTQHQLTLEVDRLDALADPETFSLAVQVAKRRGCKRGIDGLDSYTLSFFKQYSFDVDGYKLFWKPEMESPEHQHLLRNALEHIHPDSLILARCSTPQSLKIGQSMGLKLFQGRYIDFLTKRNYPENF